MRNIYFNFYIAHIIDIEIKYFSFEVLIKLTNDITKLCLIFNTIQIELTLVDKIYKKSTKKLNIPYVIF